MTGPTTQDVLRQLSFNQLVENFVLDERRLPEPEDWLQIVSDWVRLGSTGCSFATKLVRQPVEAKWESTYLNGLGADLANRIETVILDAYERKVEAVTVLLAGITSPSQVASLIAKLCESPRWFCEIVEPGEDFDQTFASCKKCNGDVEKHREGCPFINVGLRYILPNDQVIWLLGLTPLPESPPTRHIAGAPFSALFLRPSPSPGEPEPGSTVHLCHMRAPELEVSPDGPTAEKWQRLMEQSSRLRLRTLAEAAHCTGKAKVTFTLPSYWKTFIPLQEDESVAE